jgi:acetyl-CoA synthetase
VRRQGHEYPPKRGLKQELLVAVRKAIGPIATPDVLQWAPDLPKTRSGKIMRRILRKVRCREAGHRRPPL